MPRMTRHYRWKSKSRKKCARGSVRTVKNGKVVLHICCPKGEFRKGRCRVGTFAKEIGFPKKKRRSSKRRR